MATRYRKTSKQEHRVSEVQDLTIPFSVHRRCNMKSTSDAGYFLNDVVLGSFVKIKLCHHVIHILRITCIV